VSVLVPCFNGARYLDESLTSVLAQADCSFEVIVSDDASTDDSLAIARGYAARDARFRVLAAQHNRGMTANWNAALAAARGNYVCKLDCDDAFRPGTLACLRAAFVASPGLTAAFCRTLRCDDQLEPLGSYLGDQALIRAGLDPLRVHTHPAGFWYERCFDDIQIWHSNAFMLPRQTLVNRLGGWDARFSCVSDTDLILRVLELGGDVAHVPHVGVWYRTTVGGVSDSGRRLGWVSIEGWLACALSLERTAAVVRLSRHLRLQHQRIRANLADSVAREQSESEGYPPRVRDSIVALRRELSAPKAVSQGMYRLRVNASRLFRTVKALR
jgi:GT2 family glycosyltransferase